ncbi:MAG: hypothetical protein OXC01_17095 [Immundisolibacterales bacterium]|nr:hypothetical protein [Immundisolibacterales bacterium]
MKTTIELPDATFRQAKTLAIARGITLKRFFTEALDDHLRRCTRTVDSDAAEVPWMAGFGAHSNLADENHHVHAVIAQEFDTVSPEDLA